MTEWIKPPAAAAAAFDSFKALNNEWMAAWLTCLGTGQKSIYLVLKLVLPLSLMVSPRNGSAIVSTSSKILYCASFTFFLCWSIKDTKCSQDVARRRRDAEMEDKRAHISKITRKDTECGDKKRWRSNGQIIWRICCKH